MLSHIASVDMRLFADLWSDFGERYCRNMQDRNKRASTEVSPEVPFNYSIVGRDFPRFCALLRNFCLTVDLMFKLHEAIRQGLHAMLQRLIGHLSNRDLDPAERSTPLLLLFWAHSFQAHVSRFYDQVKIQRLSNPASVVAYLELFPALIPSLHTTEMDIRLLRELPASFPLRVVDPLSGHEQPADHLESATQKPGLCMFFLSEPTAQYYCKKGAQACSFAHRGPATQAEKDFIRAYFAAHPRMTLQLKYARPVSPIPQRGHHFP